MKFDFYINKIHFLFKTLGTGNITILWNGDIVDHSKPLQEIDSFNDVKIIFQKKDPADQDSYALLEQVSINDYDFTDMFKTLKYRIDSKKHKVQQDEIPNNLYFGYEGEMNFSIQHNNTLLAKAAWTLAENEFEYVKFPLRENIHRSKTKENVLRDARFMFTATPTPKTSEIIELIDSYKIKDLKIPFEHTKSKSKVEEWINRSKRIHFDNFKCLNNFSYADGVIECINSFVQRSPILYAFKKKYYMYEEITKDSQITLKNLETDPLEEGSNVLIEYPSPWYSNKKILNIIEEAHQKNCKIALDLTWLPVSTEKIWLDLSVIDEIYFSMNKTWPVDSFRPAFRWTKHQTHDVITFKNNFCIYPTIPANVFLNLIDCYEFDFTYDLYKDKCDDIIKTFELTPTNILWFTKHKDFTHDDNNDILPYYYWDEFVTLKNLLQFKGKYFW